MIDPVGPCSFEFLLSIAAREYAEAQCSSGRAARRSLTLSPTMTALSIGTPTLLEAAKNKFHTSNCPGEQVRKSFAESEKGLLDECELKGDVPSLPTRSSSPLSSGGSGRS